MLLITPSSEMCSAILIFLILRLVLLNALPAKLVLRVNAAEPVADQRPPGRPRPFILQRPLPPWRPAALAGYATPQRTR